MARRECEKKGRQAKQTRGNIFSIWGSVLKGTQGGGGRDGGGGEKRRREENILESMYKGNENTHTPEGWGHSQNAGEVQRSRRQRRNTSLCL